MNKLLILCVALFLSSCYGLEPPEYEITDSEHVNVGEETVSVRFYEPAESSVNPDEIAGRISIVIDSIIRAMTFYETNYLAGDSTFASQVAAALNASDVVGAGDYLTLCFDAGVPTFEEIPTGYVYDDSFATLITDTIDNRDGTLSVYANSVDADGAIVGRCLFTVTAATSKVRSAVVIE
jgi:hypothetical protein